MSPEVLAAMVVAAVGLTACAPGCERVCNKLERCELNTFVETPDCIVSCDRELSFVSGEEIIEDDDESNDREVDEVAKKLFVDERRCIASSSCEEIAAGECFEDELFPFGTEG